MIIRDNSCNYKLNILNTSKMSLEAKGLILYILETKPDSYELSLHDLCIAHCCGQQKLERILNELQLFGYVNYELVKTDSGRIDGKFTIYDSPHDITMMRYEYKKDFEKKLSRAEKDFIKTYLSVNRRKKRDQKISSLMQEMREQIVDWELIFQYINTEMDYEFEFLHTEYWLIISQHLKRKANFTCHDCGKKFNTFKHLHVHHETYENHGREHLEEVQNSDLRVLCEDCHAHRHRLELELKASEIEN